MSITKQIKKRKSVRSYTGEPLNEECVDRINNYIGQLNAPFGTKAKIQLIRAKTGDQPVKLGTYGVISGATDFLLLIGERGVMSEVGAGYMFEQVVLYCTELGLGTCWLGGTLKRDDFLKQIQLSEGEELIVISPVGYKREKRTLLESIMRAGAGSDKRKPFGSLFFNNTFGTPLTESDAGDYKTPLEMLRLAPSASNKQPWRVVMKDGAFHFYFQAGHFSANDMGIALCHFELTCNELDLKGHFERMSDVSSSNDMGYVTSWIIE
ncbi:nitroreductase family protein [Parabacteroides sp. PF5-6]|uniref:nitroreductase family protein n=1 Tax=Parabacteroides sp. PF5-6 TaxID=1742403 RepID=UPI00240736E9|nr:nitroreductase family protein [Parabacteroides sp. PF5-6]MDF9830666.1 nitroreductase [Parabacteroides sp. PF5-6]